MDYSKEFAAEQAYLEKTQDFITRSLAQEEAILSEEKDKIIDARKDMWENVSFKGGFNNVVEANQALEAIQVHGAAKGVFLALKRILRCNPLFPGGYDPVPPRKGGNE